MFSQSVEQRIKFYFEKSTYRQVELEVYFKTEINARFYMLYEEQIKPLVAYLYSNKDVEYISLNFHYGMSGIYYYRNYTEILKCTKEGFYDVDTTSMEYKQNLMEYKLGNHNYLYTPF